MLIGRLPLLGISFFQKSGEGEVRKFLSGRVPPLLLYPLDGSNKLALLTLGFFLKEIPLRFLFYFYFFNFESYSKQHSPHSNDTV
jgi:hypothetical protein